MAVVDLYSRSEKEAGNGGKFPAITGSGTGMVCITNIAGVASGDDNGSKYRVFSDVPSNLIPIFICIHNTAITSGTDYDLGLYEVNDGAAVDEDAFADGLDMSSARTIGTFNNAGMSVYDIAASVGDESLADYASAAGAATTSAAYDIVLTANTVGSADGSIKVTAIFGNR